MKKGQSVLEYSVVIILVVSALLAMDVYFKRSVQGRLRGAADELGQQYSPKNTVSDFTIVQSSNVRQEMNTTRMPDGKTKTSTTVTYGADGQPDEERRFGNERVGALEDSLF